MIIRTQLHKTRLAKYISDFNYHKIKNQNWNFSIIYSENGSCENYTDLLNWSEIEKPIDKTINILKIIIFRNEKKIKELENKKASQFINFLDKKNKSTLQ